MKLAKVIYHAEVGDSLNSCLDEVSAFKEKNPKTLVVLFHNERHIIIAQDGTAFCGTQQWRRTSTWRQI